jgi:hypothetical protein
MAPTMLIYYYATAFWLIRVIYYDVTAIYDVPFLRLGEMYEVDFADTCDGRFWLMLMGAKRRV